MEAYKPVGRSNDTHVISPVEELCEVDTAILCIFQISQGIIVCGTQIVLDVIPGLFQATI
jgi:hypothetical protein